MKGRLIFGNLIILILGECLLIPVFAGQYEGELELFETFGDDDNFEVDSKVIRISRGVFGVNATLKLKNDCGDDYTGELNLYRSPSSNNQFQKTPVGAARGELPLSEFMVEFYKPFLMLSVKDCSNLPQFSNVFEVPLKAGLYEAVNCKVHNADIPDSFEVGSYKLELLFRKDGKVFGVRIIVRITHKTPSAEE